MASRITKLLNHQHRRALATDAEAATRHAPRGPRAAALSKDVATAEASSVKTSRWFMIRSKPSGPLTTQCECRGATSFIRPSASYSTQASGKNPKEARKDLSAVEEEPFDAITDKIPEKPVTFAEGASYSLVILAGLGIAAVAGYAVFKELIFEVLNQKTDLPRCMALLFCLKLNRYKIFGKVLARIQSDSQVTAKIGHPITGYGHETRNRAARQRIPNRIWKDEDDVEHVEVNFLIRGPHGAGKVYSEMFKDSSDRTWKFTYLLVEIVSPHRAQLMLESYVPSYTPA